MIGVKQWSPTKERAKKKNQLSDFFLIQTLVNTMEDSHTYHFLEKNPQIVVSETRRTIAVTWNNRSQNIW
jgi:hypothetical protein